LAATYFYPESGGQEADRGVLGSFGVADVQADDDGTGWHVLEGARANAGAAEGAPAAQASAAPPPPPAARPKLQAAVDWTRRFDNMQQHTGQHILSAAFEHVLRAATLSSHLGDEHSSIETALGDIDWRAVERIENAANEIVWRDVPIERHWVDDEGVKR